MHQIFRALGSLQMLHWYLRKATN